MNIDFEDLFATIGISLFMLVLIACAVVPVVCGIIQISGGTHFLMGS